MSRTIVDPFTFHFPHLDIHGETAATCIAPINAFIRENIILKKKNIVIIHGKGSVVLKKTTHEHLKRHKNVAKYYIDGMNDGQTIVELRF